MSNPHHTGHTPPDIELPDPWHAHTADEAERPQKGHGEITNAHLIVLFGVGSFFIVFLCCIAVYAYYIGYSTKLIERVELTKAYGLEGDALKYKRTALADLEGGYSWADHDHVQLPIAEAMEKVAKQYASRAVTIPTAAAKD